MKAKIINAPTDHQEEVPLEVLAQSIERLSHIGKQLADSKLKQKTILVLLQHMTKLPQSEIKIILDAIPQLAKEYLK